MSDQLETIIGLLNAQTAALARIEKRAGALGRVLETLHVRCAALESHSIEVARDLAQTRATQHTIVSVMNAIAVTLETVLSAVSSSAKSDEIEAARVELERAISDAKR